MGNVKKEVKKDILALIWDERLPPVLILIKHISVRGSILRLYLFENKFEL